VIGLDSDFHSMFNVQAVYWRKSEWSQSHSGCRVECSLWLASIVSSATLFNSMRVALLLLAEYIWCL
jgi:hypothetical protein